MSGIEPIAIIGIGCRMPGGVRSPEDLWHLLTSGVDAITEIPKDRWLVPAIYHPDPSRPGRTTSRWGGFLDCIDRFDAEFFGISPREAAAADPQQRLLLEVTYEAVEDAGLTLSALAGKRAAVHVGISSYEYGALQLSGNERVSMDAYSVPGGGLCIAANRISYFFNLIGPSVAVDTACSSALVATHLACQSIWTGEGDLAFAAGVNVMIGPETFIGFSKASMLSPDGRCKSFDSRANGYVRAEGVGVIVLKPLAQALADSDQIYALVRATAVNQDGRTQGMSVPNAASQEANLRDALRLADLAPQSIQYVEAHGTGTPVGDPIEVAALGAVYGEGRSPDDPCVIGSIKSNLGHLEAASGMAGLIKAALCLKHRQIPASLHFETPNPQIPFDDLRLRVAQRLEPWPETHGGPPRAGVNSFGLGGTNGHAVLEAPREAGMAIPASVNPSGSRAWMLPLSARSASALASLAQSFTDALGNDGRLNNTSLRDICFSASLKRSHHDFRLALVAHDRTELREQLQAFVSGDARAANGHRSGEPRKPVFVCSGMGQQRRAMGCELLDQEPVFRRTFEKVNDLYGQLAGWSLLEKLTADESTSQIQETRFGQPAIFALQVALAALWRSWGIEPAAVCGHSAGEVVASHIAGILSLEDAVKVIFHRSRLQHRTAGQGAMLAVGISRKEASHLVEGHLGAISIAAVNGLNSITLSGERAVLSEIEKALTEGGHFSRTLQVDVPFHSPKMEQLQAELIESLRDIRPGPASIPFFSTVTGTALKGPELNSEYWYWNIRQPVLFRDGMERIIEAGHTVFLEIGAHPILRNDIGACLEERAAHGATLSSLRRNEREQTAMLGSLARLYALGHEIDWRKLYPSGAQSIKLPRYPFQGDRHWRESHRARQVRLGERIHPLLGNRIETAQPTWSVKLHTADLSYLEHHRIAGSIVFPGAAYVEMALAAAREIFGPVPCVVEEIEFQKFLFLDEKAACSAQLVFDTDASAFDIYACANASDNAWELHARGCVRRMSRLPPAGVDVAQIRGLCTTPIDVEAFYRRFAEIGYDYGPSFRSIAQLWIGDGQIFAEICAPASMIETSSDYRLHPIILDACFQTALAALPSRISSAGTKPRAYVPVKIECVRFYGSPSNRIFASTRLISFSPTELKANLQVLDESGNCLIDVQGFICRPTENSAQTMQDILYEYQWKLSQNSGSRGVRNSSHLLSLEMLAPVLQREAEVMWQRLDRGRFQNELRAQARATTAAYIVQGLRKLGWTPGACAAIPLDTLTQELGIAPQYQRWLRLILQELTADETASAEKPQRLWKALWNQFPEYQIEATLLRSYGERLPALLRGDVDPLTIMFAEGGMANSEYFYQDSPTFRINNLLVQKAMAEIVCGLPKGMAVRILEIGGGTGGMTAFLLPVLPKHCTEYVFTDVSTHFLAHAQRKFASYPFVTFRALDIERAPIEQGFEAHCFDVIIAGDVLHATEDLRSTLGRVRQLLGSCGLLLLLEVTRPWLNISLVFGLLKGWWAFKDTDIRSDGPTLSQEQWRDLLGEVRFGHTICVADCPDASRAQHSVILARGPQLFSSDSVAPQTCAESKTWLIFIDQGTGTRTSTGVELASQLCERGDRIIQVAHGADFQQLGGACFTVRPGNFDDVTLLMKAVSKEAPRLAGLVHLWSLDIEMTEGMTSEALASSAKLGCFAVMQLIQALTTTEGLAIDSLWLVTRAAQAIENRSDELELAQSPLWGLGRVVVNEYQNLRCRLVDLTTCSKTEIALLADTLSAADETEDEIALHGELKYVRRLARVSPITVNGLSRRTGESFGPFRVELLRPGDPDLVGARPLARTPPNSDEVEIEVMAAGLNFLDLMLAMGMYPKDALTNDSVGGKLLGIECAGRVVAVGKAVSEFAVGDDVVASGVAGSVATHIKVHRQRVTHKPPQLTFEQAATIPAAFGTAWYSLHTLGQMRPGERVLIHSATGGVGLAAVQLAMKAGAVVFATAGSPEKRELLAALGVPHVMDSRSLAFADEVMVSTNGEGVDLVLNSLAGEAIDKNFSILRAGGQFIEIGKVDIYKNRKIGMRLLRNNISLFVVDLNTDATNRWKDGYLSAYREVLERCASDELRPLPHRAFPVARIADAFRTMARAKHVGKLVVSMQDPAGLQVAPGRRDIAIDRDASYLITGGLGGFGLAVADRLARRGARHLLLVGRSGPSPSAQAAIGSLRQHGTEVTICLADVTDFEQARRAITAAQGMAPLRGIMHGAMVLEEAPIERLTEERMWKAMAPKIMGAWNLHTLTHDAPLDFFILFSSITSVLGIPGQANYAAGNAFLDMLAYYRRARGLPALTVNWGALGETGFLARNPEIARRLDRLGAKLMPLSQTLDALDELMSSHAVQIAVAQIEWKNLSLTTGSRIPARFASFAGGAGSSQSSSTDASARVRDILEADAAALPSLLENYIRDILARAMATSDARIDNRQPLRDLGLDSLIAVEVRNRVSADFGVNVPLATFMQSVTTSTLAAYIAERLQEASRSATPQMTGAVQTTITRAASTLQATQAQ